MTRETIPTPPQHPSSASPVGQALISLLEGRARRAGTVKGRPHNITGAAFPVTPSGATGSIISYYRSRAPHADV